MFCSDDMFLTDCAMKLETIDMPFLLLNFMAREGPPVGSTASPIRALAGFADFASGG